MDTAHLVDVFFDRLQLISCGPISAYFKISFLGPHLLIDLFLDFSAAYPTYLDACVCQRQFLLVHFVHADD